MSILKHCSRFRSTKHTAAVLGGAAMAIALGVLLSANVAAAATCTVGTSPYTTIQDAVNDLSCNPINVPAGSYTESVTINRSLTLNGANAGINPNTDTRVGESTITGNPAILITASNVFVDGFTIMGPTGQSSGSGIITKVGPSPVNGSGAVIENNIVTEITGLSTTAQAITVYRGPDGVVIANNLIENVSSPKSAKGVFIEDTASTDPSIGVSVMDNVITNVHSDNKGAYGVTINNGNGSTPNAYLLIKDNSISDLTSDGGWVHAVGIEADAPNAIVSGNSFSELTAPGGDVVAVWFEGSDPSYASSMVNQNNFNFPKGTSVYGIAVGFLSGDSLDGTCNYWGSEHGPAGQDHGEGALVSPLVTFSPWLKHEAPDGPCGPKPKKPKKEKK